MEKLDKILKRTVSKKTSAKPLQAAEICFYANEWGNGSFEAVSFSGGILKLFVESSPAASELFAKQGELADHVNKKAGRKVVFKIRVVTCK
jgi:hypothetical protein